MAPDKSNREVDAMKRVLIVTTVSGFVPQFEMNNVRILQEMGYEVHYASNFANPHYGKDNSRLDGTGIVCHQVDFVRSPFRLIKNVKAYRQLRRLMKSMEFQLVHCHTPMGSVLGRLAASGYRRMGTKVLYTAHGFHFFKGAPLVNWLCYYPVEWLLAKKTDVLITINEEDYERAKKLPLSKTGRVEKINGVGIDVEKYQHITVDRGEKRRELGVSEEDYLLVSIGELTKRKNHQIVVQALASMKAACESRRVRYLICGEGPERGQLEDMIKQHGLEKIVLLPGYRTDVREILAVSDCFVFPSRQEGLSVALMEALAAGLPCICSDVRGNRDLIAQSPNGLLVKEASEYAEALEKMLNQKIKQPEALRQLQEFSAEAVCQRMKEIYRRAEGKG